MATAELLRKVRRLEIHSRHLVEDLFSGGSESVFKGRGVEFEEVRPYVPGDEVRDLDWNVTARLGSPYVKRFVEERELTVMLVVDVSRSMRFGTHGQEKRELAAELVAILGFAAMRQNDRVGITLAAGRVEHFVPPARGRVHLLRLLRDVLDVEPVPGGTRLGEAARFLARALRRRSLVFWISDFEDRLDVRDWRVLARRHELTALALRDPRDEALPRAGWVLLEDLESGARRLVNTSSGAVRQRYAATARERRRAVEQTLARAQCPVVDVRTDRPYVAALMRYFGSRRRARRLA
ncbi:MAG TPA: DUF58 domain-containing protein [Candidatus Eisenbacteria bacterium]|nr:DUF58 domain-containing protein [Candidatus Eisenbacteria bacterium]